MSGRRRLGIPFLIATIVLILVSREPFSKKIDELFSTASNTFSVSPVSSDKSVSPVSSDKPVSPVSSDRPVKAVSSDKPVSDCGIKGSICSFGNYEWLVLEVKDDKALLLSKDVLVRKPYNTTYTNVTWETSTLRAWLNNEFLNNELFNKPASQEQARIALTTNINEDNQWYGTPGGNTTEDRIFLLSISEANHYFGKNSARIAKYNGSAACWWLRSPGFSSRNAAYVYTVGTVGVTGDYLYYVHNGVRPALWLNL
jgi:hypothetical protein